jgi:hypothetical protein
MRSGLLLAACLLPGWLFVRGLWLYSRRLIRLRGLRLGLVLGRLLGDEALAGDLELFLDLDVVVELDESLVGADRADAVVDVYLMAVDLFAGGLDDGGRHLPVGYRPEELAAGAAARRYDERLRLYLLGDRLELLALALGLDVEDPLLLGYVLDRPAGHADGEPPRDEVVAGIPARDLDDLAHAPDAVDVLLE